MTSQIITQGMSAVDLDKLDLIADIQFNEPFASAAINRKFFGIMPEGIYRGFKAAPAGGLTVVVGQDSVNVAVVNVDGFMINVHSLRPIMLDIPVGREVYAIIEANYAIGRRTTQTDINASIKAADLRIINPSDLRKNHVIVFTANLPKGTTEIKPEHILTEKRQNASILDDVTDELRKLIYGILETIRKKDPFPQYATKDSPALTGKPTSPTPTDDAKGDEVATAKFVLRSIASLIGAAPDVMDTLQEISAALNNNPNFANEIISQLSGKLSKAECGADIPDKIRFLANIGAAPVQHKHAWGELTGIPAYATRWPTADEAGAFKATKIGSLATDIPTWPNNLKSGIYTRNVSGAAQTAVVFNCAEGSARTSGLAFGYDGALRMFTNTDGNRWHTYKVYTDASKPSLSELGAAPASHKHAWGELTGIPAYATRWPTASEVGLSKLNNWPATSATNDASDTKYATAGAVKKAYDLANGKMSKEQGEALSKRISENERPVLSCDWISKRSSMWKGYGPADGQIISNGRKLYPDAWAAISAGLVPVCSEAEWLANPSKRGCYTVGDGKTNFRVPDYNGKQPDALAAVFFRGDGKNAGSMCGEVQHDVTRKITGYVSGGSCYFDGFSGALTKPTSPSQGTVSASSGAISHGDDIAFDSSLSVPTGPENRPVAVTGCWAIRLFGAVQNAGSADAAALATAIASLSSRVAALEARKATCLVHEAGSGAPHETVVAQLPANITKNSRYVLPNPFGNNTPVICIAEIFINNNWADAGFIYDGGGYGCKATYVQGEGIVVQTGYKYLSALSSNCGGGHSIVVVNTIISAPCRVFVRKLEA